MKETENDGEKTVEVTAEPDKGSKVPAEEEEVDIDLSDPEVATAALRIQANFKGFKTRKALRSRKVGVRDSRDISDSNSDCPYPSPHDLLHLTFTFNRKVHFRG